MSNNTFDPSDICNNINGFNVIECANLKQVDIYISIPNLGYGFIANVLNSFGIKYGAVVPDIKFSVGRIETSPDITRENNKFVPVGSGINEDFIVIKIPANNICSKDIELTEPVILPIPVKVRNTAGTNPDVSSSKVLGDPNLASYSMMTNIIGDGYSSSSDREIDTMLSKMIAAESMRCMSYLGIDSKTSSNYVFTGKPGSEYERVEFAHLNRASGSSNIDRKYFDITGEPEYAEYSECFTKPAVYIGISLTTNTKRLYYSEELTKRILPNIKITGKSNPPKVEISKATSFLGVDESHLTGIIPSTDANFILPSSVKSFSGFDTYEYILSGSLVNKEVTYGAYSSTPISDLYVKNRTGVEGEETVTISLYTPVPPIFSEGDVYSNDPTGNGPIYVPFTQAYVLPFGSYSRAASNLQEPCAFCGKSGKVGLSTCPVCGGSGSIRCPRCISNIEDVDGTKILAPGFMSQDCPVCKDSQSDEYTWRDFAGYESMTIKYGFKPRYGFEPCECAKRAIGIYKTFGTGESFSINLGKADKDGSKCTKCGGSGMVPCTGCNDPEFESPRPGTRRMKCSLCNDSSSDGYLGHPVPNPGMLRCTQNALDTVYENKICNDIYYPFVSAGTPCCDGTGSTSIETCPACNGNKMSYRFRSIDLDTSVPESGFENDAGISYTVLSGMEVPNTINVDGTDFATNGLPFRIKVPVALSGIGSKNMSVYFRVPYDSMKDIPDTNPITTETVFKINRDEYVLKWLPPRFYDITNNEIFLYYAFPVNTEIRIFLYDSHSLNGVSQNQGYYLLNERETDPVIAEDTVYDGTWCYAESVSDVPIYSNIGPIPSSSLYNLSYILPENDDEMMLNNGFTHLVHATSRFISTLNNQRTKAMPYIMTSGYNGSLTSGYKSRFVCIDKNNLGVDQYLSFTPISELESIPNHIKISLGSSDEAISELNAPSVKSYADVLSGSRPYSKSIDTSVANILAELNRLKPVKSVELNTQYRYPYITKSTATKIVSNSSSDDMTAVKGCPIDYIQASALPDDVTLNNSIPLVGGVSKVKITSDSMIAISDIIESKPAISENEVYSTINDLLMAANNIARETHTLISEALIRGEIDETNSDITLISPTAAFDASMIQFVRYEESISESLNSLSEFLTPLNIEDQNKYKAFTDILAYISSGDIEETPAGFESALSWMCSYLYMKVVNSSSIISSLCYTENDGSSSFLSIIKGKYTGAYGYSTIRFTEPASHRGLLVYNMKKTYLLMISQLNLLASVLERTIMMVLSIMNRINPGSVPRTSEEVNLLVQGFMGENEKLCFPVVETDIDLLGGTLTSQVKLNHITKFLEKDRIAYDLKIDIRENSTSEAYTIPLMGMGVNSTTSAAFGINDSSQLHAFVSTSESSGYDEYCENGFMTNLEIPNPEVYSEAYKYFSSKDYMIYSSTGIRYISDGTVLNSSINVDTLEESLKGSNTYTVPKISQMKATGKIDMGYIFPYESPGARFDFPNPKISSQALIFAESHPRTTLDTIQAKHAVINPKISGGYEGYLIKSDIYHEQMKIVKDGVDNLIQFFETPYVIHRLYSKLKSDSNHKYAIYFVGGTSTTLDHEARHGESLLMSRTFNNVVTDGERSVKYVPVFTDQEIVAEMYDESNSNWKSHTTTDDLPRNLSSAVGANVIKDRNFNLWLSKRMAYNTFVLYMSEMKYRYHRMNGDIPIAFYNTTKPVNSKISKSNVPDSYNDNYVTDPLASNQILRDTVYTSIFDASSEEAREAIIQQNKIPELVFNEDTYSVLNEVLSGELYVNNGKIQYVSPDGSNKYTYNISFIYSESDPVLSANEVAFQPFHCYGFGSLLQITNEEDFNRDTAQNRRQNQRMAYVFGSEDISGDPSRLYPIEHLKVTRTLPLGSDIDTAPNYYEPYGRFDGSWYNPNISYSKVNSNNAFADENYTWHTNVTALPSEGDALNMRTLNHTALMIGQLSETYDSGRSGTELISMNIEYAEMAREYYSRESNKQSMNDELKSFITANGSKAFAVPRNSGNLTSKIWLKITRI